MSKSTMKIHRYLWLRPWYQATLYWLAWVLWMLTNCVGAIWLRKHYHCGSGGWWLMYTVLGFGSALAGGFNFIALHRQVRAILTGSALPSSEQQEKVQDLTAQLFTSQAIGLASALAIVDRALSRLAPLKRGPVLPTRQHGLPRPQIQLRHSAGVPAYLILIP